MDLFDAIKGRKSIRRFKQMPVPDKDIRKILDAARFAPSANNTQPWSFVVIKDKAVLGKMADAARDMLDRMAPHAENEKQAQRLAAYKSNYYTFFENAPVVIAVFMEAYDAGTDRLLAKMGYTAEDIKEAQAEPRAPERSSRDPEHAAHGTRPGLWFVLDDRAGRGAGRF